jgi:TM2 domain-containing membrane protein YozV
MKIYKKIILIVAVIVLQISNVQISQAAFVIKKEITTAQSAPSPSASVAKIKNTESKTTAIKLVEGKKKDKTIAALFAILLGGWGAHRFYMGQNKLGYIRLGLKILSTLLFVVGYAIVAASLSATSTELIAIVGILMYLLGYAMTLGNAVWNIVDFVRILTGDLEPDGGFAVK